MIHFQKIKMNIKLYMLNWIKNQGKGETTPSSGDYNAKLDTTGITTLSNSVGIRDLIKKIDANNLDLSNLTSLDYLFHTCRNLEEIEGKFTCGLVTSCNYVFNGCENITSIDLSDINTRNCTSFIYFFGSCLNLVNITFGSNFSFESVSSNIALNNMFTNSKKLSDSTLNSFLKVLLSATSYTGTKTLSTLGMAKAVANKCATLPNWSNCEALGWTTGY